MIKFSAEKVEDEKSYFEMSPEEAERAVKKAIRERDIPDQNSFATILDEDGRIARYYKKPSQNAHFVSCGSVNYYPNDQWDKEDVLRLF